ncbi:HAD domain-containing protein [Massilia sp. LXY-6]|uniref:HAD domain-containing protein n=1 Tax=Massilia sp. LXY-6 TaxID=3379823 RepID=UPI003EDF7C2D
MPWIRYRPCCRRPLTSPNRPHTSDWSLKHAGTPCFCFLDLDGVRHPTDTVDMARLLCRRPLLEALLRCAPWVDVVISTNLRENRTLGQLQAIFSDDITPRIVGCTPKWYDVDVAPSLAAYPRQAEI